MALHLSRLDGVRTIWFAVPRSSLRPTELSWMTQGRRPLSRVSVNSTAFTSTTEALSLTRLTLFLITRLKAMESVPA